MSVSQWKHQKLQIYAQTYVFVNSNMQFNKDCQLSHYKHFA